MTQYSDMRWHGPAADVDKALSELPEPEAQVGPIELDGVSYVLRRQSAPTPVPTGLEVTGPQLSIAILGVFA